MHKPRPGALATVLLLAGLGMSAQAALGVSAQAAPWQITSDPCPDPKAPLGQVQNNVDRERPKPVTEDGASAQLQIASAYALSQPDGAGANWCMGYEVANDGPDPVPLLDWPLAGIKLTYDLPPNRIPRDYVDTYPYGA